MLHYLIAAGIGAAVSTAAYVGVQLWTGKPITWKGVAISAVGGIVAGALCATPGGVAALQAGGARALTFVAANGGAAAGTEKVMENVLEKKPLGEGVGQAVSWGVATAPVAYLGLRGYMHQLQKVFFPAAAAAYTAAEAEIARGVAVGARTTARTTAVNVANAIAIAGANPTVAKAISGAGNKPPTTLGDPSDVRRTPPPADFSDEIDALPPPDEALREIPDVADEGAGAIASDSRPIPARASRPAPVQGTEHSRGMVDALRRDAR